MPAINTVTYKWTKCFVPFLKLFTSNNYAVKDSFGFAKDITQQSSKLFTAFLDVALHKKWSFPLRISSVNVTKSEISYGFGHIY